MKFLSQKVQTANSPTSIAQTTSLSRFVLKRRPTICLDEVCKMQKSLWKERQKICFKLPNSSLFKIKCLRSCSAVILPDSLDGFLQNNFHSRSPFLLLSKTLDSSWCQIELDISNLNIKISISKVINSLQHFLTSSHSLQSKEVWLIHLQLNFGNGKQIIWNYHSIEKCVSLLLKSKL